MRRFRNAALALLVCSALLFAFISGVALIHYFDIDIPFPGREAQTLSPPQAVPAAASYNDDAWAQWQSIEIPTLSDTYFIRRMEEDIQLLCAGIYQGISNFEEEIKLPAPIEEASLAEIMWLISYDCPELFQISGDYSYFVRENEQNMVISIKPTYIMTPEEYALATEQVSQEISAWLQSANAADDYHTERTLYERLINACTYEENGTHAGSAYGAIILGSARCEGYSKAMCLALRMAGIESLILTGEARTSASNQEERVEKHAWNVAKINGSYCQLDPTWDDPDDAEGSLPYDTCYAYFNLTDEEMYRSRSLDAIYEGWELPVCDDDSLSYFKREGTFIEFEQELNEATYALLEQAYNSEKNYVTGKFSSQLQLDAFLQDKDAWISNWYNSKRFSKGSYHWVTYADSRVFAIFNLHYE